MPAADPAIAQYCVEGYLFVPAPFALLVLKRPPSRGGIWVPVSGKVEPFDRDERATVRREVEEETGFAPAGSPIDLEWVIDFDGPDGRRWRLRAFGIPLDGRWVPTLSAEHVEHAWLDPQAADARLHYADNRGALRRLLERISAGAAPGRFPLRSDPTL